MYKKALFFVFLCCQLYSAYNDELHGLCKHKKCQECIIDPTLCAWCSADNLKLDDRCQPANSEEARKCLAEYSDNPKSNITVDLNDDLNFTSTKEHVVQIKPQQIKMKLRVGEQMKFQFHYKAVENYPIDLYFLLDASHSMSRVRDGIFDKSKDIYDAMYNLTTNVHLGYGTFIDKKLFPFNNDFQHTCYSFKHNLNPTPELEKFQEALKATIFGQNFDAPEGGLDALAQVMACKDKIEFRSQSRKVIIFLTDNYSHQAGDGHAAGIINPYDGGCYLNDNWYYSKEKEMDYPSVGIINKLATDDQFTIFFVVTTYIETYNVLADAISGALVSTYQDDTVSEKLKDFYEHISNNIHLEVYMAADDKDHFEITFDPDCSKKEDNCAVVIGEEIHITGQIKLKEYYGKDHIEIPIVQKGLKEELILNITIISHCNCDQRDSPSFQVNSSDCNAGGDLQCGICNCFNNRNGPTCACVVNNTTTWTDTTPCVKDGIECSKNGKCICGSCSCRPGFAGQYCQVRTDDCQRDDTGALCSGNGKCWNGTCKCNYWWEGEKCDCSKSTDLCKNSDGYICNNRGHCECEHCKCEPLPIWDVRDYQDDHCNQWPCDDCHTRQCRTLIDCLACYNSKNSTKDCLEECGDKLTVVTHNVTDLKRHMNVCVNARVAFGCYANFSYIYNDEAREIVLYLLSEPNCKESYYKYGAISLLTALAVGMAVMWVSKLLTDAHDRAEYNRFLSTPEDEDCEVENPTYRPPSNVFQNPNFKRSFKFR